MPLILSSNTVHTLDYNSVGSTPVYIPLTEDSALFIDTICNLVYQKKRRGRPRMSQIAAH